MRWWLWGLLPALLWGGCHSLARYSEYPGDAAVGGDRDAHDAPADMQGDGDGFPQSDAVNDGNRETPDLAVRDVRPADGVHRDVSVADVLRPDVLRPDVLRPDVLRPDVLRPDVLRPDVLRPDVMAPDVMAPDVMAPDVMAPDTLAADTLAPDVTSPDVMAPDTLALDVMTPDVMASDTMAPDVMTPDVMASDTLAPDVMASDAMPPDSAASSACAPGHWIHHRYGADMVVCEGTVTSDQCDAEATHCNTGANWTLCSATEYRARGGTRDGVTIQAWVGGCVPRQGSKTGPPRDGACNKCDRKILAPLTASWYCGSGVNVASIQVENIGLGTHSQCLHVGDNVTETGAYWQVAAANLLFEAAVCCRQ